MYVVGIQLFPDYYYHSVPLPFFHFLFLTSLPLCPSPLSNSPVLSVSASPHLVADAWLKRTRCPSKHATTGTTTKEILIPPASSQSIGIGCLVEFLLCTLHSLCTVQLPPPLFPTSIIHTSANTTSPTSPTSSTPRCELARALFGRIQLNLR